MNDKIKELTENIYNEGVVKAREEADSIIAEARNKAEKIIAEATERAKSDIAEARRESEMMNSSVREELRSVSEQILELTRQELKNLVAAKVSENLAKTVTDNQELLKALVLEVAKNWRTNGSNGNDLDILVPENAVAKISSLFQLKAVEVLTSGLTIKPVPEIKSGFVISGNEQGFKVSFTEEDFAAFFEALLKPKIREFLFEAEK